MPNTIYDFWPSMEAQFRRLSKKAIKKQVYSSTEADEEQKL
jgi:hypothetical protein